MVNAPYANEVESVMYVMVCYRPDLAYAVSVLSIFTTNPGDFPWKAMKHLIK